MENTLLLLHKLKQFTKKYYYNQMLKGALLCGAFLLGSFLLVAALEHFGFYSSLVRAVLFYGYLFGNLSLLVYYVFWPLLKLFQIRPGLSNFQAAAIIGKHFPDVADKLLNTLELYTLQQSQASVSPLVLASIEQRTKLLSPIPFQQVINYRENNKYIKWVVLPFVCLVVVYFISPKFITGSTQRLVLYNQTFEPDAPFQFQLLNDSLRVMQSSDVELNLKITGEYLPDQAYIELGGARYRLNKLKKNVFSYSLKNVQQNIKFQFAADGFFSKAYQIDVVPKAGIASFQLFVKYPAYLNKAAERFINQGNIVIPDGSFVTWELLGNQADEIKMILADSLLLFNQSTKRNQFDLVQRIRTNMPYALIAANNFGVSTDTFRYEIGIIPDAFPEIKVTQQTDSSNNQRLFFFGSAADDYGITNIKFIYKILDSEQKILGKAISEALKLGKQSNSHNFYHFFDLNSVSIYPGQTIEYFFEVEDNDGVNGRKKVTSEVFSYRLPTIDQMEVQQKDNDDAIKSTLKQSITEAKVLQQESQRLKRKVSDQQSLSWEDKKKVEDLLKREKQLEENLKEAVEKHKQNIEQKDKFNQIDKDLLEKQKQLQEMADKLLNDDLKKLINDLQKMLEKDMNKDKLQKNLDDINISNKEVEKELDRMLDFFKQLALEEQANKTADKLEQLAKELDKAASDAMKGEKSAELKDKQDALNKEFDKIQAEFKDLQKENNALEQPLDLNEMAKDMDASDKDMDGASQDLQQNKAKDAAIKQKQAADKMKQMASNLRNQMQQGQMQQMEEDVQALRMLLENLLKFSFNQEALMERLKDNSNYSPIYVQMGKEQQKLKDDARLIEDSLVSLAKRVIQIKSFVTKEVSDLNFNLEQSLRSFSDRNTREVRMRQQYAMTHANNLTLMLSETLDQMQQMMNQAKGNESCNKPGKGKPGSGKPSFGKMSQMQKQLNERMQEMQKQMMGKNQDGNQKGKSPGNKPDGKQQGGKGDGSEGDASEFAKMVAQQEAIRRELNKLQEEFRKQGMGAQGDLDRLSREMEKVERELLNKQLTGDLMRRQEDILTRLLESEKAQREREEDNQRESQSAKNQVPINAQLFETFKRKQQQELELLRTNNPSFNQYYKEKIDVYFNQIAIP